MTYEEAFVELRRQAFYVLDSANEVHHIKNLLDTGQIDAVPMSREEYLAGLQQRKNNIAQAILDLDLTNLDG